MNLARYPLKASDDFRRFEFFSEGPKGRIRKMVEFQQDGKDNFYNLAFGDWDEVSGSINYKSRSNNGDRDKVMATIASAVFEFMLVYSDALIYAEGETDARTRLYQMGINKHLADEEIALMTEEEIDLMFERFTDNITVGDPKDFIKYDSSNDPYIKRCLEHMRERMKFHPRFANDNNNISD
jgi:hypothetical protein